MADARTTSTQAERLYFVSLDHGRTMFDEPISGHSLIAFARLGHNLMCGVQLEAHHCNVPCAKRLRETSLCCCFDAAWSIMTLSKKTRWRTFSSDQIIPS